MHHDEKRAQEKFVALLKEKVPDQPINTLVRLLPALEKGAIYRRLRGEVYFTFAEMAVIAAHLGISLDRVAEITSPFRTQGCQLHVRDYCEFNPVDLDMSYSYIQAINAAAADPGSEFCVAGNTLPLHISLQHLPLYRLLLLKWKYRFGRIPAGELSYASIQAPPEEEATYGAYLEAVQRIGHTVFIWDHAFLTMLINDINYFYDIRMITPDEMRLLKEELHRMLDTLERYADTGRFEETGNRIDTYVSLLNFDTTYYYITSENVSISMSTAFGLGAFTSLERNVCEDMKAWVAGLKRSSSQISGVNLKNKIRFFKQQRDILEQLLCRV